MTKPSLPKEKQLVQQCLEGNILAQKRLYRMYVQAMYNTTVRMIPNRMDAEDVLQESFGKVFQKLHYFRGDSTLGAWIKRIVINTALNFIQSKRNVRYDEIENSKSVAMGLVSEPNYLEKQESKWSMEQIHRGIKMLPDGCRVVLNLYLLEGYQHQEIASILEITESTSKTQYRRARKLLSENLRKMKS